MFMILCMAAWLCPICFGLEPSDLGDHQGNGPVQTGHAGEYPRAGPNNDRRQQVSEERKELDVPERLNLALSRTTAQSLRDCILDQFRFLGGREEEELDALGLG